jgi:hypothetical protein
MASELIEEQLADVDKCCAFTRDVGRIVVLTRVHKPLVAWVSQVFLIHIGACNPLITIH